MGKTGSINIVRVLLALFFLFAAILPLVGMFGRLLDPSSVEVFSSPQFATACINSIVVSLTATFISLCCAMVMSWVLCRTRIRFKGAIAVVMTLPMLIPSLAHGMGLVFLLGSNGVLTNVLGLSDSFSNYGFWGIVAGSVL